MSDLLPFEKPGTVERNFSDVISPIEEIIEDARNGRMFVLVDHEDRENDGGPCNSSTDGHSRNNQLYGKIW